MALSLLDWWWSITIGILVVSYWHGSWTLLDIWTCDQPYDATLMDGTTFCFAVDPVSDSRLIDRRDSGLWTYFIGSGVTVVAVLASWAGAWNKKGSTTVEPWRGVVRWVLIYILGFSTVSVWHGIWYLTDYFLIPENPLNSWWTSCVAGTVGAYVFMCGGCLLAPPAIFLIDGPGNKPPPVAVSVGQLYCNFRKPNEKVPMWLIPIDFVFSFLVVPWFVVWFWRGAWLLMDNYLWGFLSVEALHDSIGYSFVIGVVGLVLGSDEVDRLIPYPNTRLARELMLRLRTIILAVGAVGWWRFIWYFWDEYLYGATLAWAWGSHLIGVFGMTYIGCFACVTAPPSTLGIDFIPVDEATDDPLFSFVPIPTNRLKLMSIGTQPTEEDLKPSKPDEELQRMDEENPNRGLSPGDPGFVFQRRVTKSR